MAARIDERRPNYPKYAAEPVYGGNLPSNTLWPPDTRPSSLNPAYTQYMGTRGRNFAGLGEMRSELGATPSADPQIKDYPNELDLLTAADDVQGNGVFDPNDTHGNVHPDYGVFADHVNLPGFIVRDQFWRPSEVIDATARDADIMYVPSGAISVDAATRHALKQRAMWDIPPGVAPRQPSQPADVATWNRPINAAWAVKQGVQGTGAVLTPLDDEDEEEERGIDTKTVLIGMGIVGIAVGILAATLRKA